MKKHENGKSPRRVSSSAGPLSDPFRTNGASRTADLADAAAVSNRRTRVVVTIIISRRRRGGRRKIRKKKNVAVRGSAALTLEREQREDEYRHRVRTRSDDAAADAHVFRFGSQGPEFISATSCSWTRPRSGPTRRTDGFLKFRIFFFFPRPFSPSIRFRFFSFPFRLLSPRRFSSALPGRSDRRPRLRHGDRSSYIASAAVRSRKP